MASIEIQCPRCKGSGIARGCRLPRGDVSLCSQCNGEAKIDYAYELFSGVKKVKAVRRVAYKTESLSGRYIPDKNKFGDFFDEKLKGETITYQEFLDGKRPKASE